MYESPLSLIIDNMATEIAEAFDKEVLTAFKRCRIDIDKDELIKALAYDRGQYEKGYADGYTSGLAADRWISVEDRLPEADGEYLVRIDDGRRGYYKIAAFSTDKTKENTYLEPGYGWSDYDSDYGYYEVRHVAHWMPLPSMPEQPEEVDNDDR